MYRQQVQTQQHHQNLDDDPHEGSTGTQSQHLWTEPSHKDKTQSSFNLLHILSTHYTFSASHIMKLDEEEFITFFEYREPFQQVKCR